MRYNIIGKNFVVSDKLKEKIISKIDRLSRLFDDDTNVQVTVCQEKLTYKVEVTIPLKKRTLRAEVKDFDLNAAIDQVVDVTEKQMIKYKSRLKSRSRHDHSLKDELMATFDKPDSTDIDESAENGSKIEKMKKFEIKPMDAEDAVMEMELMGHNFFVFRNGKTDDINVVYKRKNGGFGLIEPEY